ncbi:MAG: hypothetical protein JXA46_15815 [Dehalococcoidales bacterium]|nr:hypothetical protein [Dehalococcoidales bacterium]
MKLKISGQPNINPLKIQLENVDSLSESLNGLIESGILARAANLARKGDLQQAELLLQPLANKPGAPVHIIDLLAKVYAQQKKIREAQVLWLRALQMEPSNKHILKALLRCAELLTN